MSRGAPVAKQGQTGGIVVARLDRFARSAVDALESIKRLNEAGARLVSVEDNFDGSTPMGRVAIGILTLVAELELERIKENWSSAINSAVARGVHISARPPTGYTRDENGRLKIDKRAAKAVAEVSRARAVGSSWSELARYLRREGLPLEKTTGERYPVYYCIGRYGSGPCPARATIRASYLDAMSKHKCSPPFRRRTGYSPKQCKAAKRSQKQHAPLSTQNTNSTSLSTTPSCSPCSAKQSSSKESRHDNTPSTKPARPWRSYEHKPRSPTNSPQATSSPLGPT